MSDLAYDTYVTRLTPTQFVVRVHPELISDSWAQTAHVAASTCARHHRMERVIMPYLCKITRHHFAEILSLV